MPGRFGDTKPNLSFPGSAEGLGSLVDSEPGQVVMKIDVQLLRRGAFSRKLLIQKYGGTI